MQSHLASMQPRFRGGGGAPPAAPGDISDLTATAQSTSSVLLEFTPSVGATTHQYRVDGGTWTSCDDNSGSQLVTGLTAATEYDFEVRGRNGSTPGNASNIATETTDAEGSYADPILTLTSDPGTNPPEFTVEAADLEVGWYYQLDFTDDGTDPDGTPDSSIQFTSDMALGGPVDWNAGPFAGDTVLKWRLRYGPTLSGPWSDWSNTLTDTTAPDATFSVAQIHGSIVNFGYGSGPGVINDIAIQDGDKIQIDLHCAMNGAHSVTGVTANAGAITFTSAGAAAVNGNARCYTFYADTSGVTELDLSIAVSDSTNVIGVQIFAIRGAAAGAPTNSSRATNHTDLDGGLAAPAGGALNVSISQLFGGVFAWTGATELSEFNNGTLYVGAATQDTAAAVTATGTGGADALRCATEWSPA